MAEDLDVEALLEAPYRKGDDGSKSRENGVSSHKSSSSKSKHQNSGRDRHRSRSREKRRGSSRDKEKSRRRTRSRSKERRERRRSPGGRPKDKKEKRRSQSPLALGPRREREKYPVNPLKQGPAPLGRLDELSPEERDARTVFCMQLSQRVRARDLEEFFSAVGKVRDVRLIICNKTRRFKGIAYVEFKDPESVALAMGLSGQKLLGIPIIVQHTQAEKNRAGNSMLNIVHKGSTGPMRLYVGSLHFNITEDMLRGIFEPFGKIDNIQLIMDPETGRSKGYGFLTFHDSEDAKRALEQLNGFELAGRPMKVGHVTERTDMSNGPSMLDSDELDRSGIELGATGRLQLMFKLAEGTGMQIPAAAATALNMGQVPSSMMSNIPPQQTVAAAAASAAAAAAAAAATASATAPPITTQCFMLSNMFDPSQETNPNWDLEIRDDVIEECNKHGGVLHVFVDVASPQGNCYVKCPTISTAVAAVTSLHGRWFAGRVITAAYVPVVNYHSLFPDAMTNTQMLQTSTRRGI